MLVKQEFDAVEQCVEHYLRSVGIRSSTKAYQYLRFALLQMQLGTPFEHSIWELTSIYFCQGRRNVLSCVRRELSNAFRHDPEAFSKRTGGELLEPPPSADEFLHLATWQISQTKKRAEVLQSHD